MACGSSTSFDNTDATTELADPAYSCRFFEPAQGVGTTWFRFVPTSATVEVSLCNPGTLVTDTLLAIYTGPCNQLVEVACNDDGGAGCGPIGWVSRIATDAIIPGQEYFIQVASWDADNRGPMELTIACAPSDADECATAPLLGCDVSVTYEALAYTFSFEDPIAACDLASDLISTVWFSFVALSPDVRVSTCNPSTELLQTVLTVFQGPCGALTEIACNNDGGISGCGFTGRLSSLTLSGLTVGQTYTVRVDAYDSLFDPGDNVTFSIDCLTELDDVEFPRQLGCGESITFDNSALVTTASDPPFSCHVAGPQQGFFTAWFAFTPSLPDATISLCNPGTTVNDTLLAVYAPSGLEIACNDDAGGGECGPSGWRSALTVSDLVPGDTYLIQAAGWNPDQSGIIEITLDCFDFTCDCPAGATPENEPDCGNPVDTTNAGCTVVPPVFSPILCGQTVCGTVARAGGFGPRDTDWYEVVTTNTTTLTWVVASEHPLVLGFVSGSGSGDCAQVGDLDPFGFTDDACTPFSVTVPDLPPGRYWWFVGPFGLDPVTCGTTYTATLIGDACVREPFDDCSQALSLSCGTSFTFNNTAMTTAPDDPAFSCHVLGSQQGFYAAWFRFLATGTQADVSLCNPGTLISDTLLAVYSGSCGAFTELACNDDGLLTGCGPSGWQSRLTVTGLTPGRMYSVQAAGWSTSQQGQIQITLDCSTPFVDCNANGVDDAQDITAGTSRDCFSASAGPGTRGGPNGIPDECECLPDWNRDTVVNSTDVSDFVNTFFADQTSGTVNGDIDCNGVSNSTDVSDFINLWFAAQAGQLPFAGCAI